MKSRFTINPLVVFEKEDDGAMLFNPETGEIKLLNTTGAFIFQNLDGKKSFPEMVKLLQENFEDAPKEDLEKDLNDFLADLRKVNLIGELHR